MDYVTFFEQHIKDLKKTGKGYLGWCPFHNDEGSKLKGFYLNPDNGLWKCFSCGEKGNAAQFCKKLGLEIPEEIQKQRRFYKRGIRNRKAKRFWEPETYYPPPQLWQEKAMNLVEEAYNTLVNSKDAKGAREWLNVIRGLNNNTIKTYRLGWCFKDRSEPKKDWGLPVEGYGNLLIPSGLVIPYIRTDSILKIKVRRPDIEGGEKYQEISGSANLSFYTGQGKAFIIVVESELDALLLLQEVGDIVDVIATGSVTNRPDSETTEMLRKAQGLLISLDNDEAGERQTFVWWLKHFSNAEYWPVTHGKDHTEAFRNSLDLKLWVKAGLKDRFDFEESIKDLISKDELLLDCEAILCPYKGFERRVHPEVCKWHRETNDPECKECNPSMRIIRHKRGHG